MIYFKNIYIDSKKSILIKEFEFSKFHTLIKGINGSGKSTFISYINDYVIKNNISHLYAKIQLENYENILKSSIYQGESLTISNFLNLYIEYKLQKPFFEQFCKINKLKLDIDSPVSFLSFGQIIILLIYVYIEQNKRYILIDEVFNHLTIEDSIYLLKSMLGLKNITYLISSQFSSPSLDILFNEIFKEDFKSKYVFKYNDRNNITTLTHE